MQDSMLDDALKPRIAKLSARIEEQRHRIDSQPARKGIPDCDEPIVLPQQILWCANNNGAAKQWLLTEELPWWFFGSFLNYCASAINVDVWSRRIRRCYPAQRRLVACLGKFPMRDDELVQEMKLYLTRQAPTKWCKGGFVDLETLKSHDNPELVLLRAQEELSNMIFSIEQRTTHQMIMALDMATVPDMEIEDDEMAPAPAAFHTFALPLRLGAPSSQSTLGSVEQQHHSHTACIQDHDEDVLMKLD